MKARKGQSDVVVTGAREHNLRDVSVAIPRGSLTTVTGVSGSGKSSLAFDTIFKEGQRRFVESLSAYARQFLGQGEKPQVDHIEGLSPTVSVDQKTVNRNPRSTVGTITEVLDHLRLLYARLGTPHCPQCDREVTAQTADQVVDRIVAGHDGEQVMVLAPIVRDRKGEYRKELEELLSKGYVRARIDGTVRRLDEPIKLERYERHTIEVVLDRMRVSEDKRSRLAEAVEKGFQMGEGQLGLLVDDEVRTFSSKLACIDCGIDIPEMEPRTFSFNSPQGACEHCDGLGMAKDVDPDLIVPDPELSIDEGAVVPSARGGVALRRDLGPQVLEQVCDALKIPRDKPWKKLTERQRGLVMDGAGKKIFDLDLSHKGARIRVVRKEKRKWAGVLPVLRKKIATKPSRSLERFLAPADCPVCEGTRLNGKALAVRFGGEHIGELTRWSVSKLLAFLDGTKLESFQLAVGERLLKELHARLAFLDRVGLGYLSIDRSAATLSGGESQRIRLATQVGSMLRGIVYVLDEPSIGLHQRDNRRLIETLEELRDAGNTVLVVEHDLETMEASDHVIDVGPGAGREGGLIVSEGTPSQVRRDKSSVTGAFLSGRERIEAPESRRKAGKQKIVVKGARANNLKGVDVSLPLGLFSCVTGVSGSGKSSLVDLVLKRELARVFHNAQDPPGAHDAITGLEHLDKVIEIDQSPIGRTPRSNPATYTKVWDLIRDLFAGTNEAKVRGYTKSRFSFNVKGGRCEACQGAGVRVVEMQFLSDVVVPCQECSGRRFNPETREITYRSRSIDDVLAMTVAEALEFFANHKKIKRILETLSAVGLDYMHLGQPSTTLSGGEAQRIKLAAQLHRPPTGRTLYLLDEPTTGLHFLDIRRLLAALQSLVDGGNSVVVIEHNTDVIQCADWVVDLGPDGGSGGGEVVYCGPYPGLLKCKASHTGRIMAEIASGDAQPKKSGRKKKPVDRALDGDIVVRGAALHNLKKVDARFPAGQLTVVTGPSGSGKTSLAFDTLFAEGQRRFVECLSTYARQFLGRLERPPLESIEGLAPAIAIDQKTSGRNPRSTVATTTEIHDYLRLLYARLGLPHCPDCGLEARGYAPDRAAARLLDHYPAGTKGMLLAPLFVAEQGELGRLPRPHHLVDAVDELSQQGYRRVLIDGEVKKLDEDLGELKEASEVWLVVDRITLESGRRTRILDSVSLCYREGEGVLAFEASDGERILLGERPGCPEHGFLLDEALHPRHFSFNHHQGACETCHGLGITMRVEVDRFIVDESKPLFHGAMVDRPGDFIKRADGYFRKTIRAILKKHGATMKTPWNELEEEARETILRGATDKVAISFSSRRASRSTSVSMQVAWKGLLNYIEEWHRSATNEWWAQQLDALMRRDVCPSCEGERLGAVPRSVQVDGRTMGEVGRMTVEQARAFVDALDFEGAEAELAEQILAELRGRLGFLDRVGLGYLTLGRSAATLSGGEAQRIRLATQIGNSLTGVIYVLDEPTIGLHQRDTARLLGTLEDLRDLGNSVIIVEHDAETMEAADWIVDMGPGAGRHGGEIVFEGAKKDLEKAGTLTADYLLGRKRVAPDREARTGRTKSLRLKGATTNNLQDVDVQVPLGRLTAITGVSGSGKSSLLMNTLAPAVQAHFRGEKPKGAFRSLEGLEHLEGLVVIDQTPIGISPKSNPASYIKAFDAIRTLFSTAPLAKMRGYGPGRFSFNTKAGRCAACEGRGSIKVEMHFLPDVWVTCEECKGRRYNRETLAVEWRGKTIADVLAMEVHEAVTFFENHPRIVRPIKLLEDVGLGYMQLGQSATTLSGGEAQRVKLARELGRRSSQNLLYLLDEPTTGLHFDDVAKLVRVLHRLVEQGHTVVLIEHDLDVIASADHVIDVGPEGGAGGGRIIATGTPEELKATKASFTGQFLGAHARRLAGGTQRKKRASRARKEAAS